MSSHPRLLFQVASILGFVFQNPGFPMKNFYHFSTMRCHMFRPFHDIMSADGRNTYFHRAKLVYPLLRGSEVTFAYNCVYFENKLRNNACVSLNWNLFLMLMLYMERILSYGLDGPGSNPGEDEIFRPSRPALGPTQPPVKWVPCLSRG